MDRRHGRHRRDASILRGPEPQTVVRWPLQTAVESSRFYFRAGLVDAVRAYWSVLRSCTRQPIRVDGVKSAAYLVSHSGRPQSLLGSSILRLAQIAAWLLHL